MIMCMLGQLISVEANVVRYWVNKQCCLVKAAHPVCACWGSPTIANVMRKALSDFKLGGFCIPKARPVQ